MLFDSVQSLLEASDSDTVVKILCHVYPLRAWCNARVV